MPIILASLVPHTWHHSVSTTVGSLLPVSQCSHVIVWCSRSSCHFVNILRLTWRHFGFLLGLEASLSAASQLRSIVNRTFRPRGKNGHCHKHRHALVSSISSSLVPGTCARYQAILAHGMALASSGHSVRPILEMTGHVTF